MSEPRILIWDIETAPALVYVWSQWQTNVIATKEDWYMLSVAYRWQGEDEIHFVRKAKAKNDDRGLVMKVHKLLDEADVVVAHNGDRFDWTKAYARFLFHDLGPVSPTILIDTKKETKRHFNLYSNSLKEIARYLGIDQQKMKNSGWDLWDGCMHNDEESWVEMELYNRQDVVVLEEVYYKLAPYMNHPGTTGNRYNAQAWLGTYVCTKPNCGSSDLSPKGWHRTKASAFRTVQCNSCRGYSRYATQKMGMETGVFR